MKVFLISGKAGSGKTNVANLLKKYLGNTVITNFSKYIKLFALEFTDWDGRDLTKPRKFLQEMGDMLRALDSDFLIKRMIEDFKVYETKYDYVVISDVRLIHELESIKNNGIYEVVLIRVNAIESKRKLNEEEKGHKTELELDGYSNFDYVLENRFDENLEREVLKIVEKEK